MKITKSRFKDAVNTLLEFVEEEKIKTIDDIASRLHRKFNLGNKDGSFVEIALRKSESNTNAYKVSYIIPKAGLPIDITLNSSLGYTKFIIKMAGYADGYCAIFMDQYKNVVQSKLVKDISVQLIKGELEGLVAII